MKILVVGVSGMLGSVVFDTLSRADGFDVLGTARSDAVKKFFPESRRKKILSHIDILQNSQIEQCLKQVKPDLVINCVGLIKQLPDASDPVVVLPINSIFPHRLSALCYDCGARLIHISTDCVFDGKKGNYIESDIPNAVDLYGMSKSIGELSDKSHAITLRTSIIGHELNSRNGLVEWFLSQTEPIKGFTRAIFSGLPTAEIARVIKDFVIPRPDLNGLYHVSAKPISKFDLLSLIANVYGINITINPDKEFIIDRSLNSELFQSATGYTAPDWLELVELMMNSKIVTKN